ncbi:MAG: hypothetical protein QOK00_106 [Thermoleophilaceae bacterium]|nr:hypothetical protein [Thermoleophilaceae bacterium]
MGERGDRRRRLRERRRVREALLLDLGALVYELHRQGRRAPELLQQKAAELTLVDDEVRRLEAELDGGGHAAPPEPEGAGQATEEVDAAEYEAEGDDEELDHEPPDHEPADDEPESDEPPDHEPEHHEPEHHEPADHEPADHEPAAGELTRAEPAPALAEHEEPRA